MRYKNIEVNCALLNNLHHTQFEDSVKERIIDLLRSGWKKADLITECVETLDRLNPKKTHFFTKHETLAFMILAGFKHIDTEYEIMDLVVNCDVIIREMSGYINIEDMFMYGRKKVKGDLKAILGQIAY